MEVASSIAAIRVAQRTDGYIHTHTNLNTPMQTLLRTHAWTQTNTLLLALGMYCIVFSFSMINEAEAIHKKAKNKRSLSLITLPATIKLPSPTIVQTDESRISFVFATLITGCCFRSASWQKVVQRSAFLDRNVTSKVPFTSLDYFKITSLKSLHFIKSNTFCQY